MALSVLAIQAMYALRKASPAEVLEDALSRIDRADPFLHVFRTVLNERARNTAEQRTADLLRSDTRGALHGIPVAVKEVFGIEGERVCGGSRVLEDWVSPTTATAVARLEAAGAIVVGLTRSHEFALGITTQGDLGGTRNPWNLDHVPGGSSGGSAAAVAAGLVPIALGSDTGGSTRIPAAFCGVAGLKPSFGAVSTEGMIPLAPSLDHVGLIGARIEDVSEMWAALGAPASTSTEGGSHRAARNCLRGLRVGVSDPHIEPFLAPDVARSYGNVVEVLTQLRCQLRSVSLPAPDDFRAAFVTMMMAEASHTHRRLLGTFPDRAEAYGRELRQRLETAAQITLDEYLAARARATALSASFAAAINCLDVVISPVAAGGPSTIEEPDTVEHLGDTRPFRDLVMGYTTPHNFGGWPACSVPAGLNDAGMPIGVQIAARRGHEADVLSIAAAIERALPLPTGPESGTAVSTDSRRAAAIAPNTGSRRAEEAGRG